MARTSFSRKQAATRLLFVLLILSVFVAILPLRFSDPLRRLSDLPLRLAQRLTARFARWAATPLRAIASRGRVGDVEGLREQIDRLRTENLRLQERLESAERKLKELGASGLSQTYPRIVADVIGGDASSWRGSLVVSAGSRAGVRTDMPVVWGGAVVGKVVTVAPFTCRVLLVTDPAFRAAVRFGESGARGILVGRGDGRCRVDYVSHSADVRPGEMVVTAGLDEVFPAGFLVGRCTRASRGSGELALDVEVEPRLEPMGLDSLEILLWRPPEEPPPVPDAPRRN